MERENIDMAAVVSREVDSSSHVVDGPPSASPLREPPLPGAAARPECAEA